MDKPDLVPLDGINVKDFGASGNGHTDDTRTIQRAIDESIGVIYFPSGSYRITAPIELYLSRRRETAIVGYGARLLNFSHGPALRLIGTHSGTAGPETLSEVTWEREIMPIISGIEIAGMEEGSGGLYIEKTIKLILHALLIQGCDCGIHLAKRNRDIVISDCHIYNNRGAGVFLDNVSLHQVNIGGCHISYNKRGGIRVEGGDIRNLQICGNDIEYNYEVSDEAFDVADILLDADQMGIREGAIAGNTVQAAHTPEGANIRIRGVRGGCDTKAGLFSITGNHISSQDYNIFIEDSRGICVTGNTFIRGFTRNIRVERSEMVSIGPNVFDRNPDYGEDTVGGIYFRGCRFCSITGVILDHPTGGKSEGGGGGIEVIDSMGINITGSTVVAPRSHGILLKGVRDSLISGCLVAGSGVGVSMPAIREMDGSVNNLIVNNSVVSG